MMYSDHILTIYSSTHRSHSDYLTMLETSCARLFYIFTHKSYVLYCVLCVTAAVCQLYRLHSPLECADCQVRMSRVNRQTVPRCWAWWAESSRTQRDCGCLRQHQLSVVSWAEAVNVQGRRWAARRIVTDTQVPDCASTRRSANKAWTSHVEDNSTSATRRALLLTPEHGWAPRWPAWRPHAGLTVILSADYPVGRQIVCWSSPSSCGSVHGQV